MTPKGPGAPELACGRAQDPMGTVWIHRWGPAGTWPHPFSGGFANTHNVSQLPGL